MRLVSLVSMPIGSSRTSFTAPAHLETLPIAVCGLLADASEKVILNLCD